MNLLVVRLQKFLADAGVASRRASEQIILAGRVTVNGETATELGMKVEPGRDRVVVDSLPVRPKRKIYLAMNKPPAKVDPGFTWSGSAFSTVAGILGAAGALCIVFAVTYARRSGVEAAPLLVAPLVFSFAPIVNCLISLVVEPPEKKPSPVFFLGLVLAAAGAFIVLKFKPEARHHAPVTAQVPPLAQKA